MIKIEYIYIENYKGIRKFEISNLSNLNIIAGVNGAGKSTIIDAIKILLSWLVARIKNEKGRGLNVLEKDITIGQNHCFLKLGLNNGVSWQLYKQRSRVRSSASQKTELAELTQFANQIAERIGKSPDTEDIPLLDVYGVNRAVIETPMRIRKAHKLEPIDALSIDMSQGVNFHDFFIWFREMEDIENEQYRNTGNLVKDKRLEAVRHAIEAVFPEYSNFKVQRNPRAFTISKGETRFYFNQLSDGEKAYIALVSDIARKIAMTHPSIENPLAGDGIVLIDEIELHLHPSWQREVIGNLQTTFPNCQFIITTHSPHVVSCVNLVEHDKLIGISNGEAREICENQYGQESDMILSDIFQMNSLRNPIVQKHIDKVWQHLKDRDCESAEFLSEYSWLQEHLVNDDKIFGQIKLQMAIIKKGL